MIELVTRPGPTFQRLCPHGSGFTNSGDDINECTATVNPCGDNGACENLMGSYRYQLAILKKDTRIMHSFSCSLV